MALPKNIRNYKAYLEKKKRGPVKTFFHITKNENVPAIEKKGLLANHPNANINSAFQPFRKHGSTGGGVWVTTEPTAFPVYGTTIGGRSGDASARADALSTFKIDIPKAELPKMLAVQDPYGKNILRKGNDPQVIESFSTWLGNDVPTTVFLNDMKPEWLKNLGYVEERAPIHPILNTRSDINELKVAEAGQIDHPEYHYSGTTYWHEPYKKPVTEIDRHNLSEQFREAIAEALYRHANSEFGFNRQNQINAVYDDLKQKNISAQDILDPNVMRRYNNTPQDNRRSTGDWRLRWTDGSPFKPTTLY